VSCKPPLGGASLACRAADGYEGYAAVTRGNDITWVGCLAHARRKFDEALKTQKKKGIDVAVAKNRQRNGAVNTGAKPVHSPE